MSSFLIVDDSSIIRKSIRKALAAAGIEAEAVYEAGDGREALNMLMAGTAVHLIFLDVNMPVMNGLEFLREMKQQPGIAEIPVVVVSTEGSEQRCAELLQLGIRGQLRKPVRPEVLAELVQQLLGGEAA